MEQRGEHDDLTVDVTLRHRLELYLASEWRNRQTRQLEGLVPSGACGFKSRLRHYVDGPTSRLPSENQGSLLLALLSASLMYDIFSSP
jgi:hypothetical protein